MNNRGFTLIELLATMVILGIVLTIAIPTLSGLMKRQKEKVFKSDIDKFVVIAKYEKKKNPFFKDSICFSNDLSYNCNGTTDSEIMIYDIEVSPDGIDYKNGRVNLSTGVSCLTDGKTKVILTGGTYTIEKGENLTCLS